MKLHGIDDSELMDVTALGIQGKSLTVSGTMMGAMPIEAVLKPAELRQALKLLNFRIVLFLIRMLFTK